jgi:hypothetical protein
MGTIAFKPKLGGEWYDIQFSYDEDLVALIKSTIPGTYRSWDRPTHTWSANATWAKAFAVAARHAGHTTVGIGADGGQHKRPPPLPPVSQPQALGWADILLARCGTAELRKTVYRQLSKALHTDVAGGAGGDLQQELNDARAKYRKDEA